MWVLSRSLDRLPLKKLYLILLILLFSGIVLMQVLSTRMLDTQREHSRWVGLVERQKVLSQQMVKLALLTEIEKGTLDDMVHQLSLLNEEWSQAHFNLKFGSSNGKMNPPSSEKIEKLILRIQPHKDGISDAVNELLMVVHVNELRPEAIHKIRTHEGSFLLLMDELSHAYQLEIEKSTAFLHGLELFCMLTCLLALLGLLISSYKMQFYDRYAFVGQKTMEHKAFFNEAVADEFMLSQESGKQLNLEAESHASAKKHIAVQKPLAYTRQRIKVLMMADTSLPTDHIAWFLNKWEIDFTIVKNKELVQKEIQSQTFDMVLMSQPQSLMQENNCFFAENTERTKIPIVTLVESDIKEIHAQIYGKSSADSDSRTASPGALYKKIKEQLPKEKWGV